MTLHRLRPFWYYYGGKFRAAPKYPAPRHTHIVEPFAGAAGYSMRYPGCDVTLVDSYPAIVETWRFLIGARRSDIMAIPIVEHVDDLPDGLPDGARFLVGWNLNSAAAIPRKTLSAGNVRNQSMGSRLAGWTAERRERTASQVSAISHWKVIEGDYTIAPRDDRATYFVDPPYQGRAGSYYARKFSDYPALAEWCRGLPGQVIVCEQEGATWLPFSPLGLFKAQPARQVSSEVIWYRAEQP